ncbi:MAG: hypothetical protein H6Q03_130 [Acidobacteria bacterium]|jgi:hypothetical protein|nr:hypothetical protein [Acidobacteriota bacterium]
MSMEQGQGLSFADRVRIRNAPETVARRLAGRVGEIHGFTMPASSGVDVIGASAHEVALGVYFDELKEALWFAPELLDFVDHGEGTTIRVQGSDVEWVKTERGDWLQQRRQVPWRARFVRWLAGQ